MSLSLTLNTAISGLQTQQAALQIVSNNVSNATTEGYTRKTAETVTRVLDGLGVGVDLGSIRRTVDQVLLREIRESLSALGAEQVAQPFYKQMQDLFGSPGEDSSISATITDLGAAMEALAATPEGSTQRIEVINAALALVRQVSSMSRQVQQLRTDVERRLSSTIDRVNEQLQIVADLNEEIKGRVAMGETTAELDDKRDLALDRLAGMISIQTFQRSSGEVVILADEGTLLDTFPNFLSHTPGLVLGAGESHPTDIDGIKLNHRDVTNLVTGGEIKGLVDLRDRVLPGLQAELDELSGMLRDEINALHNKGVAYPPPSQLGGTRLFDSASDVVNLSGSLRFAVVTADGETPENLAAAVPFEVDLSAIPAPATIQDVVDAINAQAAAAPPQVIQAQLVSVGTQFRLQISTISPNHRLVLDEGDSQVTGFTPDGGTAETVALSNGGAPGFSHFFGLNDFFISPTFNAGDGNQVGLSRVLDVRQDIVDNPALLARGASAMTFPLSGGEALVSSGDNSIVQAISDKFNEKLDFDAVGGHSASKTSFAGYAAEIVFNNATATVRSENNIAIQSALNSELRFRSSSLSGVNVDEELANMIVIQQAYSASARLVTTVQELFAVLQQMVR